MMTVYEKGDIVRNPQSGERAVVLNYPAPGDLNGVYAVLVLKTALISVMNRATLDVCYPEYAGRDFKYVMTAENNMTNHFKN